MFSINRLRLEIKTTDSEELHKIYGFDIPFKKGLNLIAGENSKGKSTINTLIFYALGMEELLGGQNDKALDKALKKEFDVYSSSGIIQSKNILTSVVYIEIVNNTSKVVTLRRNIKVAGDDQTSIKTTMMFESKFSSISNTVKSMPLFLRSTNNNEDEFGFYRWFAAFIGLELPKVPSFSKTDGESVLYLQTIFPALFIEQTKGWSDFLSTIPYFGIQKNKEKTVAFILGLKELEISATRDRITKEENDLRQKWNTIFYKIKILAEEYSAQVNLVPSEITADKNFLQVAALLKHGSTASELMPVKELHSRYSLQLELIRQLPLIKVGDNKEKLRKEIEVLYKEQDVFIKRFQKFDIEYRSQKTQLDSIKKHLRTIEKEISAHQGINNIIKESIIISDVYHKCPTCSQEVSDDLLLTEGVTIEKLSVDENLTYLKGQKKLMDGAIESLEKILEEKNIMRKYFLRKQREFEEKIKLALQELITDDRDYSEQDALSRVRLETTITDLNLLQDGFEDFLEQLTVLSDAYRVLEAEKAELESEFEADKVILKDFEEIFKNRFLGSFGYSSNLLINIFIQKTDPFKYFPVFKHSEDDTYPQPIRNNSSASDFIRTLWAFSLALLQKGINHPGVILFDEPGQHSVKSSSLKALFESCSKIKDKQVIIFTSIQKMLTVDSTKPEDKLDLEKLIENLKENVDYTLYKIGDLGKSIKPLN